LFTMSPKMLISGILLAGESLTEAKPRFSGPGCFMLDALCVKAVATGLDIVNRSCQGD
jgi:hypothetical protein